MIITNRKFLGAKLLGGWKRSTYRNKKGLCVFFSPSRRTVSSLVTDCESEPDGLEVLINWTEDKSLMKQTRTFDEANANVRWILRVLGLTSLWVAEVLFRKRLGRVRLEVLTSLEPHLYLTWTSFCFIWSVKCVSFWGKNLQPQNKCCTFAPILKKGTRIKEKEL